MIGGREPAGAGATEFRLRVVSTLVLIPLAVAGLWLGGVAFALLVAVGVALMLVEWRGIIGATRRPWVVFALALATGAAVVVAATVSPVAGLALVAAAALAAAAEGRPATVVPCPFDRLLLPAGVVYAGLPGLAAIAIRGAADGWLALGFVFVVVWATDIGAYFAGRTIGGPKLMPKVSPKKTWAGAIGGLVAAVAAGTGLVLTLGSAGAGVGVGAEVGVGVGAVASAALLSIASQAGDLFESSLKRRFGVKDSGTLIPGHGGILDRVDGMVAALVVAWVLGAPHGLYGGGLLRFF